MGGVVRRPRECRAGLQRVWDQSAEIQETAVRRHQVDGIGGPESRGGRPQSFPARRILPDEEK